MSKKTEASKATETVVSPFEALSAKVKTATPKLVGVQLFEAKSGSSVQGIYVGQLKRLFSPTEVDPDLKDGRTKYITNVFIRDLEDHRLLWRTPNDAAVMQFTSIPEGTCVRLTCVQKGSEGNGASVYKLEQLASRDEVMEIFEGDTSVLLLPGEK